MTIGEERDHFGHDPITDTYTEQNDYSAERKIGVIITSCIIVLAIIYFISYSIL